MYKYAIFPGFFDADYMSPMSVQQRLDISYNETVTGGLAYFFTRDNDTKDSYEKAQFSPFQVIKKTVLPIQEVNAARVDEPITSSAIIEIEKGDDETLFIVTEAIRIYFFNLNVQSVVTKVGETNEKTFLEVRLWSNIKGMASTALLDELIYTLKSRLNNPGFYENQKTLLIKLLQ